MDDERAYADAPPFRFGLRALLLGVTGVCIVAGMFWFVSLVLLLLGGVLLAQCLFFLIIQRLVNFAAGSPNPNPASNDTDDAAIASTSR